MMLKISIILPNFNGGKYLEQAIKSFVDQDYIDKELIIVDGKSTDNSHKIIEEFSNLYSNIIWIKEEDKGISSAFNIGLKYISGDIIGFFASDDIMIKGILSEIAYMNSWCEFDAIYFDSYLYYKKLNKCVLREVPSYEVTKLNLLKYGTTIGFESIYFRKHIYEKYRLDENNKYSMDYELYLNILSNEENLLFLKMNTVGVVALFDDNISSKQENQQRDEAIKVAKKYSEGLDVDRFFDKKNHTNKNITFIQKCIRKIKSLV